MHAGLDLTFDVLTATPGQPAWSLLAYCLDSPVKEVRWRAICALVKRAEPKTFPVLIDRWKEFDPEEQAAVVESGVPFFRTALRVICSNKTSRRETAVSILKHAASPEVLPAMIDTIIDYGDQMGSGERRFLIDLICPIAADVGHAARFQQAHVKLRPQLVDQLLVAAERDSQHQSDSLLDALLSVAEPGDDLVTQLFEIEAPVARRLISRLEESRAAGVLEYLCLWQFKKTIPEAVANVLRSRCDLPFRHALLAALARRPQSEAIESVARVRKARALQDAAQEFDSLNDQESVTLVAVLPAIEKRTMVTVAYCRRLLERCPSSEPVVVSTLARLKTPTLDLLLQQVKESDSDPLQLECNFSLAALIDWSKRPSSPLAKEAQRLVDVLSFDNLLRQLPELNNASARRFAHAVRQVDDDVESAVATGLKHPVPEHRRRTLKAAQLMQLSGAEKSGDEPDSMFSTAATGSAQR